MNTFQAHWITVLHDIFSSTGEIVSIQNPTNWSLSSNRKLFLIDAINILDAFLAVLRMPYLKIFHRTPEQYKQFASLLAIIIPSWLPEFKSRGSPYAKTNRE